jgi:hypothetical protein
MSDAPQGNRRIVTEVLENGRSAIVEDGPTPAIITVPERPGYIVSNVWVTNPTPAPIDQPDDSMAHTGILPPKDGTILRVIEFPPEPDTKEEFEVMARATFKALYGDIQHTPDKNPHPGMHTTETVDYAICLSGEITALMEENETIMKAGDILIQRGTAHAWANRSGKPASVCFVLIDGKF